MTILLGYALIFIYVSIFIFAIGPLVMKFFGQEISRKVIHISLFALWFFVDAFFKLTIHQIVVPLVFLLINLLSYKFKFFKSIERDVDNSPGTVYFAVAISLIAIISFFVHETYDYVYYGVAALTLGDGFASLFGHLVKSKKIFGKKTYAGSAGCLIVILLSFVPYYFVKGNTFPFWNLITISVLVTLLELVDKGLDNLTVTLSAFGGTFLFNKLGLEFQIGLAIGTAVILCVFLCKLITYYGSLLSGYIAFSFYYFGGYRSLLVLFSCYVVSVVCALINKTFRKEENIVKKHGRKDVIQIFVNGFAPTFYVTLYFFTELKPLVLVSYIAVVANLVDSVSSDIGVLSKEHPYDFIKRRFVEPGLSGGVSLLGTLCALAVSLAYSVTITLMFKIDYWNIALITFCIMSGTIFDSILGSALQIKYICKKCNLVTEQDVHCGEKCLRVSGHKYINNDTVNLLSSVVSSSLGLFYLLIV